MSDHLKPQEPQGSQDPINTKLADEFPNSVDGLPPWLETQLQTARTEIQGEAESHRIAAMNQAIAMAQRLRRERKQLEAKQLSAFILSALCIAGALALLVVLNQAQLVLSIFGGTSALSVLGLPLIIRWHQRELSHGGGR